jgi:hypothetical protein
VSVDTREPRGANRYDSLMEDGITIYYSPKLGHLSDVIELDYMRIWFRNKPILSGPEELVAKVIMGRI